MKKVFKENIFFFVPYFTILLFTFVILLIYNKSEIHIFINKLYSPFLDVFFKLVTWLGDGTMIVIIAIILLFIKFRYAIIAVLSGSISAIILNIIKHSISNNFRPLKYFEKVYTGDYILRFVPQTEVFSNNSFPSGHTTTAFAIFLLLSLITDKKYFYLKIIFLLFALLVAYSRIYLSQHFLIDVVAGSIIGSFTTFILFILFSKIKYPVLDKSLINRK